MLVRHDPLPLGVPEAAYAGVRRTRSSGGRIRGGGGGGGGCWGDGGGGRGWRVHIPPLVDADGVPATAGGSGVSCAEGFVGQAALVTGDGGLEFGFGSAVALGNKRGKKGGDKGQFVGVQGVRVGVRGSG